MEAEWYRKQGHNVQWGKETDWSKCKCNHYGVFHPTENCPIHDDRFDKIISEPEGLPFLSLPHPDRNFTRWWEYQDNGNFKYLPATYIQSANGCWWGKCSFCVERNKKWEVRPVEDVIEEIKECKALGFKEVFDDSGTFPCDNFLNLFCDRVRNIGITLGCNMRIVDVDYQAMKHAGFRMLLFGLESANQQTLDKINKGVKVEDYKYIIKAAKTGLEPHIAVMFGFPWETDADAINTLKLVWWLLRKGYAKTAQASFYQPDKTTFRYCRANEQHKKYVNRIYNVAYAPEFWLRQIMAIHDWNDLKYFWKSIKVGLKECRKPA